MFRDREARTVQMKKGNPPVEFGKCPKGHSRHEQLSLEEHGPRRSQLASETQPKEGCWAWTRLRKQSDQQGQQERTWRASGRVGTHCARGHRQKLLKVERERGTRGPVTVFSLCEDLLDGRNTGLASRRWWAGQLLQAPPPSPRPPRAPSQRAPGAREEGRLSSLGWPGPWGLHPSPPPTAALAVQAPRGPGLEAPLCPGDVGGFTRAAPGCFPPTHPRPASRRPLKTLPLREQDGRRDGWQRGGGGGREDERTSTASADPGGPAERSRRGEPPRGAPRPAEPPPHRAHEGAAPSGHTAHGFPHPGDSTGSRAQRILTSKQ